jgi:hypothetical protein
MLRRVALVRTDVSKELDASIIRMARIGELGTTLAVTSNGLTANIMMCATVSPWRWTRFLPPKHHLWSLGTTWSSYTNLYLGPWAWFSWELWTHRLPSRRPVLYVLLWAPPVCVSGFPPSTAYTPLLNGPHIMLPRWIGWICIYAEWPGTAFGSSSRRMLMPTILTSRVTYSLDEWGNKCSLMASFRCLHSVVDKYVHRCIILVSLTNN